MVVTTISAGISRKLNLGDFNSIEVKVDAWAQLEPGETMEAATRDLQQRCATAVAEITKPFMKGPAPVTAQVTEKFAGKPVNGNGAADMAATLNIK